MAARDELYTLVVQLESEGTEEVEQSLQQTQQTFEETADTAEEEAGVLDRFSRRWKGAMTIIAGALTLATGALLREVPVVQDLMDGLRAVVESTALALDTVMRPALQDVVDDLFDLAEAIGDEDGEGAMAALVSLQQNLDDLEDYSIEVTVDFLFDLGAALFDPDTLAEQWRASLANMEPADFMGPLGITMKVAAEIAARLVEGFNEHLPAATEAFEAWIEDTLGITMEWGGTLGEITETTLAAWVARIDLWLAEADAAIATWIVNTEARWDTFWTNLQIMTIGGANSVISSLESFVNRAVSAYNKIASKLPGVESIGSVGLGRMSTRGLRQDLQDIEARRQGRTGAIEERLGEQREQAENVFAEQRQLQITIEPPAFERFMSASLEDGVANTGRGTGPR